MPVLIGASLKYIDIILYIWYNIITFARVPLGRESPYSSLGGNISTPAQNPAEQSEYDKTLSRLRGEVNKKAIDATMSVLLFLLLALLAVAAATTTIVVHDTTTFWTSIATSVLVIASMLLVSRTVPGYMMAKMTHDEFVAQNRLYVHHRLDI